MRNFVMLHEGGDFMVINLDKVEEISFNEDHETISISYNSGNGISVGSHYKEDKATLLKILEIKS